MSSFATRFFIGQSISMLGNWIQQISLLYYVYQLHPSSLYLALYFPMGQLPLITGLPYIGKWADKIGRAKAWQMNVYVGILMSTLGLIAISFDLLNWPLALLLNLGFGIATALDIGTRQGFVLDVSTSHQKAIALDSSAVNMARILGPILGGSIQALAGMSWCFAVNIMTYFIVIYLLWPSLNLLNKEHVRHTLSTSTRFKKGRWKAYAIFSGLYGAVSLPITAQYTAWNSYLQGDAVSLGWIYASVGLGSLFLNALMLRSMYIASKKIIQYGLVANIVAYIGLSQATTIAPACLLMMVIGIGNAAVMSSLQTLSQKYVPVQHRAYAASVLHRTYLITGSVLSLILGFFLQYVGISWVFISSCTIAILGLVLSIWKKHF